MKYTLKLLAVIFLLAAVSCQEESKETSDSNKPEDEIKELVESYYDALYEGDFDKAAEFCEGDSRDLMEELADAFYDLSDEQQDLFLEPMMREEPDVKVLSVKVDGKEATVEVQDDDEEEEIQVVKKGKKWLIDLDRRQLREMQDVVDALEALDRMSRIEAYDLSGNEANDSEEFYCRNGETIPASWYNDGECDCDDCSDEPNGASELAAPSYGYGYGYDAYGNDEVFYCNDGSEIPASWVYDGECDCDDCSDE